MIKLEPMPRPPYLDLESPKAAMIAYHMERAGNAREFLTEQMLFDLELSRDHHLLPDTPEGMVLTAEQWWVKLEDCKWEEGSINAVFRDRLRFHERCLEYLVNG